MSGVVRSTSIPGPPNTFPPSYNTDISLEDAIHTALLTLKEGFEGQMTERTIEIGIIGTTTTKPVGQSAEVMPVFKKLSEAEIKD